MDSLETTGKTVEEAVGKALRELGLERDQVDVDVVSQGRPRILGFGGEPARVVVRARVEQPASIPRPDPTPVPARPVAAAVTAPVDVPVVDEAAAPDTPDDEQERPAKPMVPREVAVETATEMLEHLLELVGIEATVRARVPQSPGDGKGMVTAVLDVSGPELGSLIGRRGETIASLQYLLNMMLQRRLGVRVLMGIDVGGYRKRREEQLQNLAQRVADRVRQTHQSVTLEPMPPNERRIVHIALERDPDVLTVSIGEGEERRVAISPRR